MLERIRAFLKPTVEGTVIGTRVYAARLHRYEIDIVGDVLSSAIVSIRRCLGPNFAARRSLQ